MLRAAAFGIGVAVLVTAALCASAPPGHARVYLSEDEVRQVLFPGKKLAPLPLAPTKAQRDEIERRAKMPAGGGWRPKAWRASDGALLFVDKVLGKHEFITFAVGIDSAGAVRGIEILEYKETYGYEVRNERWRAQFHGKTARDPIRLEKDVMNIGGATLSCRHITDGVRRLLVLRDVVLIPGR
jgi:hypothetical protein